MAKAPDAFRTISEAADELDLPQHVLRFWETRFAQIKPLKRGGGRRYYRPDDLLLLKGIRHLLYDKGFTIKGVQRILKEEGVPYVVGIGNAGSLEALGQNGAELPPLDDSVEDVSAGAPAALSRQGKQRLDKVLRELLECKRLLDAAREG